MRSSYSVATGLLTEEPLSEEQTVEPPPSVDRY